jgi:hypothetical protein
MAYDRKKIFKQAEEAIDKNNLFFIQDVVAYIDCSETTFYEFFPADSEEAETLKRKLGENKIKIKSGIRSKLYKGSKASELLALYRMICTDEERRSLNQQYVESRNLNVNTEVEMTDEERDRRIEVLRKKMDGGG